MLRPRWNNVEIKLYQSCFNVVPKLDTDVVATFCNVENPLSDFISFSTSYQRCFNIDPQHWKNVDLRLECWLVYNNLGPPLSTILFKVNSYADNHFYKYVCLFKIYSMKSVFVLKYTLTILTGKNCVLLNLVQEWVLGCFWYFSYVSQSIKLYTIYYQVFKSACVWKVWFIK